MSFAGPIDAPGSSTSLELVGAIDIDRAVGPGDSIGITEEFCPAPGFAGNVDASIDLFGGTSTSVEFQDLSSMVNTAVLASFSSSTATVRVPLSVFDHVGAFSASAVVGTVVEPTDCAADGALLNATTFVVRPVPGNDHRALLGLALALAAAGVLAARKSG